MTFTTSTGPGLIDGGPTDLGPFFRRYDRRNRLVLGAAMAAGLALSAVIAARVLATGETGGKPAGFVWGMGVAYAPVVIAVWWAFGEFLAWGRRKAARADGSLPAGPIDARNGVRLAHAGFAFGLALLAAVIIQQVLIVCLVFGRQVPGVPITRAVLVTVGAVTIYFGNLWPRMPTARAPERIAAIRMKVNRFSGWFMVAGGLAIIVLGLFLPFVGRRL